MFHISWTEIEGLHQVVKAYRLGNERAGYPLPKVTYRGKIKLHGTNAGVLVENGVVTAQSRTSVITPGDDNCGFAAWVKENEELFRDRARPGFITVFFGEWCGPGIQKGCAIHQIGRKAFCIFAIHFVENRNQETKSYLITDPGEIESNFFWDIEGSNDIFILPWATELVTLNFADADDLQAKAEAINEVVLEIEACDPWVKRVFGIEGVGEGLVYYPIWDHPYQLREECTRPMFKAKGEKHRVKKAPRAVQVDTEVLSSIDEFTAAFVTEPRCEQGVTNSGSIEMKNIGAFLKWLCMDVEKESKAELEASGLEWKQVAGAVQKAARDWYLAKARAI